MHKEYGDLEHAKRQLDKMIYSSSKNIYFGGPGVGVNPLSVKRNQDGDFSVAGGAFVDLNEAAKQASDWYRQNKR